MKKRETPEHPEEETSTSELQALISYLAALRGTPRNKHTEAALRELEESMPEWAEECSDKEIEHILADRRIAALLVLVCKDEYKSRVTEIAKAYAGSSGWQYY